MDWQTLSWEPAGGSILAGAQPLAGDAPVFQSALEEAASAAVLGPVTLADVRAARPADLAGPAAALVPQASFELLGSPRRGIWVALDPAAGSELNGATLTAPTLGAALATAFDEALQGLLGEGASLGAADTVPPFPAEDLVLLRLEFRDAAGAAVALVVACDLQAVAELAAHVVALQVLREDTSIAPAVAAAAAAPAPAAAPTTRAPAAPAVPAGAPAAAGMSPAGTAAHQPAAMEPPVAIRPALFEEFAGRPPAAAPGGHNIDMLLGVNLEVSVEIGRTHLPIRDILALAPGSIVELDKLAGEPVDVLVNGRIIASGEVVVVDENFGVRITSIVSRQRRVASAGAA